MATPLLKFIGGHQGVTGSKTLLCYGNSRVMVDCGLFQGPKHVRQLNWASLPIAPEEVAKLSAVVLTHAHLDHSGYLPLLWRQGFRGPVYASEGTADLCSLLLRDAAYLEEEQANFANRTRYSNHNPALALFTIKDVEEVLGQIHPVKRHKQIRVSEDLAFEMHAGGHLVGASVVQFFLGSRQQQRKVCFSGDLGNDRSKTLKAPDPLPECDLLVLESTYGDRLQKREGVDETLAELINRVTRNQGVLLIPAFAVGRSQEVLHRIAELQRQNLVPKIPIVLDSPMAIEASNVFLAHAEDHHPHLRKYKNPQSIFPSTLEISRTPDDSLYHCMRAGPFIVVSAAGMLSGGRILHHLKRRLGSDKNIVLFTGYQAEGTKGRYLQGNGNPPSNIRIHHEEIEVLATIATIDGLSAHADYQDIVQWLKAAKQLPKRILLNHGVEVAQQHLADVLRQQLNLNVQPTCGLSEATIA